MKTSDKLVADLSGSLTYSVIESSNLKITEEEKEMLYMANWYLSHSRFGKKRLLRMLSEKFGLTQRRCEEVIYGIFGEGVFVIRNRVLSGHFIKELDKNWK